MRKYSAATLFFLSVLSIQAQTFSSGQAARAEFGQYTFTYGGATPGTTETLPNQQILGGASGLAWANGTLFVADANRVGDVPQDNRVLMFNTGLIPSPTADLTNVKSYSNALCSLCAFPAFNQLGQPNYGASTQGTTDAPDAFPIGLNNTSSTSNMRHPTAVATDGTVLVIADTDNNRVLIWNSIPTSMNQPADVVLGQADFTHATVVNPPTASSLLAPQGVWIQGGKLYVADTQNYRVLIWNTIPTSNNQPANVVLGQTNFNTGTQSACDPTKGNYTSAANELCNPVSVTSDGTRVFVADLGFNRVLIWNNIPTSNGASANVVVGQPDMVSAVANNPAGCLNTGAEIQCERNMNFPRFALSDGTRLFIADGGNDRVLIYNTIPTQNGMAADAVLGQPNLHVDNVSSEDISVASTAVDTTSAVDVTPSPTSLAFDGLNLYVADPLDNRVLVFTPASNHLNDDSVLNWASEIIRQEGVVSIVATTITANDTVAVTLGSKTYTYTIKSADTADTIAQGLVSLINAGSGDPNVVALFAGTDTGAFYVSSKGTNLSYDSIAFSVTASNTTDITATASGNGYLTAGTAATGAPGMLVEINGTNLSDVLPSNPAVATLTGNIPTTLGGAQVFMDGIATPIYSASSNQIVTQIPYSVSGRNSTSVYVRTVHSDGSVTVTNATPVYIAQANPGIFDAPATTGQARPWPVKGATHQPGNPQAVIDLTGTITSGNVLTITINGKAYNYTVQSSDTMATVTTALVNAINNAPDPSVTAVQGGAFNRVVVVARQSGAAGNGIPVSASASTSATITLTAYTSTTCCNVVSGTAITASNPAAPGETIVVPAAGLGQVEDLSLIVLSDIATGGPYNGYPINSAVNSVSATMGSNTAQVVSAGLPQGSYGVYQVQLIVPSNQPTNSATQLYIAQNAFISNTVTIPVGPPNSNPNVTPIGNSPMTIGIDRPGTGATLSGSSASVGGWVVDSNTTVSTVQLAVDGVSVGSATYGGSRSDVCSAFSTTASCSGTSNVGYNYSLDTTPFADGSHVLQVTATDQNGARLTNSRTFTTSNYGGSSSTLVATDSPSAKGGSYQGSTTFSGWALNVNAPVTSVTVSVDGVSRGSANYGSARPDVCAVYSGPSCPNVGWSYVIDTGTLSNGTHTFAVSVTASNGEHNIQSHTFTVANWTTANPMIVSIDSPNTQSNPLNGSAVVGGWAVSSNSTIGSVTVAVDGIPFGSANYGLSRPDVCAIYSSYPGCPNVGWNFRLDTNLLSDGTHTLQVTFLPVSGQGYTRTQQFQVANFGSAGNATVVSVDKPNATSGPVSGFASVGGWALNTGAAITTVSISIDGVVNGYATYGGSRTDVCARYAGSGCPNVGWNYFLDTSTLTNGTHTIDATATAANGEQGTGSSTFTVSNSAGPSPTTVSIAQPGPQSSPYQGIAFFSGSGASSSAAIQSITISVDGYPYGAATFTVGAVNSSVPWTYSLNTAQFSDGTHTLGVTATAADGTFSVASSSFTVANWTSPSPTLISIDNPSSSSSAFSGVAAFGGWAINPNAAIASVSVAIDSVPYGSAQYGGQRSDVCQVYTNRPGCPNVGWNYSVDTTFLANGTHTLDITAVTASGQSSTVTSSFVVAN